MIEPNIPRGISVDDLPPEQQEGARELLRRYYAAYPAIAEMHAAMRTFHDLHEVVAAYCDPDLSVESNVRTVLDAVAPFSNVKVVREAVERWLVDQK